MNFQYDHDYQKALDELLKHPAKHLVTILVIVSVSGDETLLLELTEGIGRRGGQLDYDDIIVALIQVCIIQGTSTWSHHVYISFPSVLLICPNFYSVVKFQSYWLQTLLIQTMLVTDSN